jgi:lipopolysaccharide export system ATP-binding protein
MNGPERPILEVDGIGKAFGRNQVLKAGAFSARAGCISVLMGRNGAGKSTLLRIAVGKVRADYGRVMYRGEFLARPSLVRMAREGLMYIPQEGSLAPAFTLREHLESVARAFPASDRLDDVADHLALTPLLDQTRLTLSGGERGRSSLALATMRGPRCLLMDEPFTGIDPKDRSLVAGGLHALRARGAAIVISGHDVEDLFDLADEVIWVTAGTTHWLGAPERAREHAQFRREYLGR